MLHPLCRYIITVRTYATRRLCEGDESAFNRPSWGRPKCFQQHNSFETSGLWQR